MHLITTKLITTLLLINSCSTVTYILASSASVRFCDSMYLFYSYLCENRSLYAC